MIATPCRLFARLLALLILATPLPIAAAQPWDVAAAGAASDGKTDCDRRLPETSRRSRQGGRRRCTRVPAGTLPHRRQSVHPRQRDAPGHLPRAADHRTAQDRRKLTGSVLLAYAGRGSEEGPPFIRLAGNNASIAGLIIAYPEWKRSDVPPVPYPPCILSEEHRKRRRPRLLPRESVRRRSRSCAPIGTLSAMSPAIRSSGASSSIECYDIGHIENIHFWAVRRRLQPARSVLRVD